jgi:DNA-binding NarL/FixJ family response regulator
VRVLIADDHQLYARATGRVLGLYDWLDVVGFAGNGKEAVALAEELQPDLILIDLNMPVMDGIEATRLIRERSSVPVLMLTASDTPADVARAREAGATRFLPKTIDPAELVARIHEATAGAHPHPQLR